MTTHLSKLTQGLHHVNVVQQHLATNLPVLDLRTVFLAGHLQQEPLFQVVKVLYTVFDKNKKTTSWHPTVISTQTCFFNQLSIKPILTIDNGIACYVFEHNAVALIPVASLQQVQGFCMRQILNSGSYSLWMKTNLIKFGS